MAHLKQSHQDIHVLVPCSVHVSEVLTTTVSFTNIFHCDYGDLENQCGYDALLSFLSVYIISCTHVFLCIGSEHDGKSHVRLIF